MKGKLKQTKGITLIALIITIIILLILAVVSIRLVVNNGILGKAEYATQKYTEEEAAEQEKLLKAEYEMAKYEGKATGTYEEYVLDKMYGLKIGDYVNYDPTKDEKGNAVAVQSYTSYSEENASADKNNGRTSGYTENQTFNVSSYKTAGYGWRVLGIENGKIQLISEEFIGPDEGGYTNSTYNRTYYYLKGQKGYIYGKDELDAIAGLYGQGKGAEGARSVTVEDINKITGYDAETAKYGKGNQYEYGNEVTYSWSNGNVAYSSKNGSGTSSYTTFKYYDSQTRSFIDLPSDKNIKLTSTRYTYGPATLKDGFTQPTQGVDENGTYNEVNQMLFGKYTMTADSGYFRNFTGTGAPQSYWLASPYVYAREGNAIFGLRDVYDGGVGGDHLYYSNGITSDGYYGVRAVVSLKSDIQLSANGDNNWKID